MKTEGTRGGSAYGKPAIEAEGNKEAYVCGTKNIPENAHKLKGEA